MLCTASTFLEGLFTCAIFFRENASCFFFLSGQPSFPRMVRPIEWPPIWQTLEEFGMCAVHKDLMEVDDNILLIVVDPQGILDQLLKSQPIDLFMDKL
jgi:hypothetical protein